MLYAIETDEGFSLEDLLQELGRLELSALGYVKHGDVLQEGESHAQVNHGVLAG